MKVKTWTARAPRVPKVTALEQLTIEVARDYAHQNSAVVHSRIKVLRCEAEETDKAVVALQAALESAKERRKKIEAMLRGLSSVVEKR